ncbi:MAG: DUF488 domain-containing protein [Chitinophagaceae bacterium]|nr:DUF488 domain-containing protein [Chitinophagaceae bacterium]
MKSNFQIKRVYEKPEKSDGYRVLIDRLWPRGLSKETAAVDLWLRDIAPSTELRKWFNHDPAKWAEFQKRYTAEIMNNIDVWAQLKKTIREQKMTTLVYAAKDELHNDAVVLKSLLTKG